MPLFIGSSTQTFCKYWAPLQPSALCLIHWDVLLWLQPFANLVRELPFTHCLQHLFFNSHTHSTEVPSLGPVNCQEFQVPPHTPVSEASSFTTYKLSTYLLSPAHCHCPQPRSKFCLNLKWSAVFCLCRSPHESLKIKCCLYRCPHHRKPETRPYYLLGLKKF